MFWVFPFEYSTSLIMKSDIKNISLANNIYFCVRGWLVTAYYHFKTLQANILRAKAPEINCKVNKLQTLSNCIMR